MGAEKFLSFNGVEHLIYCLSSAAIDSQSQERAKLTFLGACIFPFFFRHGRHLIPGQG